MMYGGDIYLISLESSKIFVKTSYFSYLRTFSQLHSCF